MSKSGLFAHFGSKQELQLATVEAAALRFRAAVIEPAARRAGRRPAPARDRRRLPRPPRRGCLLGRLLLGLHLGRVRRPSRPRARRDRRCPRRLAGELERQARIAGVPEPGHFAFDLNAVVMGANSRYRLGRDERVFDYARRTLDRLLAEGADDPASPKVVRPSGRRLRPPLRRVLAVARARKGSRPCSPSGFDWSRR